MFFESLSPNLLISSPKMLNHRRRYPQDKPDVAPFLSLRAGRSAALAFDGIIHKAKLLLLPAQGNGRAIGTSMALFYRFDSLVSILPC